MHSHKMWMKNQKVKSLERSNFNSVEQKRKVPKCELCNSLVREQTSRLQQEDKRLQECIEYIFLFQGLDAAFDKEKQLTHEIKVDKDVSFKNSHLPNRPLQ